MSSQGQDSATYKGPPVNPTIEPFTSNLVGVDQVTNTLDQRLLWGSLALLCIAVFIMRIVELVWRHFRHLFAMNSKPEHQTYWAKNQSQRWPKFKKNILYAPLWRNRHNREIQLSSAINIGTIPSRLHTIILSIYVLSNVAYSVGLNYHFENRFEIIAQLRGRTGTLAVANMIPLILLAGRNNPLIGLLQVSFDTYNLLHRWMGRVVVIEALVHTLAWLVAELASANWAGVRYKLQTDLFIQTGFVGTIAMLVILITSPSVIRHAFYETFLNVHIVCVVVVFGGVWIHCDVAKLPQLPWFQAATGIWIADRVFRLMKIVWANFPRNGKSWTKATVECLPGETCRVTLHLPARINIKPGSHAYLRFSALTAWDILSFTPVGPWESHPFSIAWTEHVTTHPTLPIMEKFNSASDVQMSTNVSFVIRARTGITRRLYRKAFSSPTTLSILAAFEGPYGTHASLSSYGHLLLIAGASGVTFQLPYLRHLILGHAASTVAARRITLVWIFQDLDHLQWIKPWMDEILQSESRCILMIKLFVTRPKHAIVDPGVAGVQMFQGRPNVRLLVEQEVKCQVGAMAVTVCGPGGLADDVREATRRVQEDGVVDFLEESFTW